MKPFRRMAELAMAALLVVALGHRDGSLVPLPNQNYR